MNWCVGAFHRWVASPYQHPDYMLIQACEKCGAIRRKDWPRKTQKAKQGDGS